jgi:glutathione S-transferase
VTKPILWTSTRTSGSIVHQMVAAAGLDLDIRFISLRKGDHKTPEYLAINPKGEVAAIQLPDQGVSITEIPAMALWIAESAPDSGLLPRDPVGRAKAMEWLAWCHFRMANTFYVAFQADGLLADDAAAAAKLRAAAMARAGDALAFADAALARQPHGTLLGTPHITAPDIFAAALLFLAGFLKLPTAHLTHLAALSAEVAAVPAIAAAMAREQEIG